MALTTIRNGVGLIALLALSACATQEKRERLTGAEPQCKPNETLACDRFADENYNCSCEKSSKMGEILDSY